MAFKMKGWSPFTKKTDSDSGKTKVKEEKLATEDKAWDDLTETEKIRRQQSMKMLKEYNVSEREKREGEESALKKTDPTKKDKILKIKYRKDGTIKKIKKSGKVHTEKYDKEGELRKWKWK